MLVLRDFEGDAESSRVKNARLKVTEQMGTKCVDKKCTTEKCRKMENLALLSLLAELSFYIGDDK